MIRIFPLVLLLTLSACGLRPLYSGGSTGAVAQTLQGIDITPIEGGKSGWLVRNALTDRLGSGGTKQYRLDVELDDKIEGFGVRSDDAVTRERRMLRARYKLVDASGKVVLDATAGSDVGIDVVSSEYATIAAENTALERLSGIVADQIVARIALYARGTPTQ
jgi:LPS-assembly lipoprotein